MTSFTKPLIIIIGILQIVLWGLPALFSSQAMADFFGVTHAGEFVHWVRFCGVANIMWGLMLIAASVNPVRNRLFVVFSILFYLFVFVLSLLMMFMFNELDASKWLWWEVIILSAAYTVLLIVFFPKEEITPVAAPEPVSSYTPEPPPAPEDEEPAGEEM